MDFVADLDTGRGQTPERESFQGGSDDEDEDLVCQKCDSPSGCHTLCKACAEVIASLLARLSPHTTC